MIRSSLLSSRRVAALTAAAFAVAACGRGANQRADSSALGPPVGANKPANDTAFANAQGTLDSLKAAGVTTKNGIDSVGSKVQAQTANEPVHDTSHLNNRATPEGVSPRGRRP